MPRNVGTLDRAVRIVVGVVLIALVFVGPHTSWGWIGILPLASGLAGICPLYRLMGFSSCPLGR
jgi:hypothetical protein